MRLRSSFLMLLVLSGTAATGFGWLPPKEQPGLIRLHNGLVLSGLCSLTNTTDPLLQNQKLELRRIDQGFRDYLVSTRQSAKVIPDPLAVPKHRFSIQQRRVAQRAMSFGIGRHEHRPFTPDGKSSVTLTLQGNRKVEIATGIVSINSQFAVVHGLSHKWSYGVSMQTLSDDVLYSGMNQSSLVTLVKGFEEGETRLNVAETLMAAGKYTAAKTLINDIKVAFPALAPRCERLIERWNDQVGARVVAELRRLRDTGQFEAARKYARRWPDDKLDAVIRVRAKQVMEELDEDSRRLESIARSLSAAVGQVTKPEVRKIAGQIWRELKVELDLNTLPRFAPYELLGNGPGVTPESQLALAATGWLMGPENATDGFEEAAGLLQIRYLVLDYLQTANDEDAVRNNLLQTIRTQEGFSPERVAAIIQNLPPDAPLPVTSTLVEGFDFQMPADAQCVRMAGRLPAEYRSTQKYPLLIALPQFGMTVEKTRDWWRPHTDRHGYILLVPELYASDSGAYDASATQHKQFLASLKRLKASLSVDDDRVFLVGHEIGGEAAMDIGTAHADQFAGIASIAGLGRRHLQWTAHNSTQLPWYVVVGTRQPYYYKRMELLLRKLLQRVAIRGRLEYCNVVLVRYAERGFESYFEEVTNLFRWMNLQRRPALPDRVEAVTLRSTDLSWQWLELDSIPERFCEMDAPNRFDARPSSPGRVSASIDGNLIRINQLPTDGALRLSPGLPDIDLNLPINLRIGAKSKSINYKPSTRDMLEDFRERRDRKRLCYMKVLVQK